MSWNTTNANEEQTKKIYEKLNLDSVLMKAKLKLTKLIVNEHELYLEKIPVDIFKDIYLSLWFRVFKDGSLMPVECAYQNYDTSMRYHFKANEQICKIMENKYKQWLKGFEM